MRLPAERCACCDRSLDQTGGVRIVAHVRCGTRLLSAETKVADLHRPCQLRCVGDVTIEIWGDILSDEAIRRVEQAIATGKRAWFCLSCSHLESRAGADCLMDDGTILHAPAGNPPS